MMAELERRRCQEHHPLECPIQSACNRAGVLLGIVRHKEGCQPRGWILQVMRFIENQKWRAKPGLGKTRWPHGPQRIVDHMARALQTLVNRGRLSCWQLSQAFA